MPEWMWIILVGSVILGLLGLVYRGVLTKSEHASVCKENTKELKKVVSEEIDGLKSYLDLKIENVILKEIKKINGNLERR